ncbi:S41 family peptidase [Aquimarina litoralis]|uniref:S41 family peptidase n=1 Tax=Aquimarina litoralis TaxID=584605 RepID=UPI001C578BF1|nr:S41 family peptidase [Aquimarina litoralis]MBW1297231.1 hypothetical protein [Aquimarina litoralis]
MKRLGLFFISSVFIYSSFSYGQNATISVKDSIHIFYNDLFKELKANYIYKDQFDWAVIENDIKEKAIKSKTFKESLQVCSTLFDRIKGDHLSLFAGENTYSSNLKKQMTQEDFHQSFLVKYASEPKFEVSVIEEHYGYIFIPGMLLLNAKQEELNEKAQEIYDAIVKVDQSKQIKGWIIDLRINVGGNSNVMLAGLYHLLGDDTLTLYLDTNKYVKSRSSLKQGVFYENQNIKAQIDIIAEPKSQIPVALLTGILTNSAGEFVALGFRGRKNTVIIGEETYGLTTANDLFKLPYDTTAAITLSYGTDRSAKFTKTIKPEIEILKEANYEDLSKDKNIIEAIDFINKER